MRDKHHLTVAVETGTYKGDTTLWLAQHFPTVHTIECDTRNDALLAQRFAGISNLVLHKGNSPNVLATLLPKIEEPFLLFLDAHWYVKTPTPMELEAVARSRRCPILLIHDFQVPTHPELGYDSYRDWVYDFSHVRPFLEQIYGTKYRHTFNTEAAGAKRGCLFVEPA